MSLRYYNEYSEHPSEVKTSSVSAEDHSIEYAASVSLMFSSSRAQMRSQNSFPIELSSFFLALLICFFIIIGEKIIPKSDLTNTSDVSEILQRI